MANNTGKTTIYDIAILSGASPSTVSAVLNGTWARRRIGKSTVATIQKIAAEQAYSTNLQARGLRQARSGLVGMIIPIHDNRFFSSLSQNFDFQSRERGFCPVIASTLRNPVEEKRIVETLISYAVDVLFIAGATDPEQLGALCTGAGLRHIFIDLPGKDAPSVVTNNYSGAQQLTRRILSATQSKHGTAHIKPYFLGGSIRDYATAQRIAAFCQTVKDTGSPAGGDQIIQCGYAPRSAAEAISQLCDKLGGLPACLFINSLTAFEGVMSYFISLPASAFTGSAIGCFGYDPFAAFLQFLVFMVRQNSFQLIAKAYELLDSKETRPVMLEIEPELVEPRTFAKQSLGELG